MQTFLPYPDFIRSAQCLDRQRLGKQRVEVLQLLRALDGGPWSRHPATLMWAGHRQALVRYGEAVCQEWLRRGYRDTCLGKVREHLTDDEVTPPSWLGDEVFHLSHRSNLKRKAPEHYGPLWPNVPDDLPYVWPKGAGV